MAISKLNSLRTLKQSGIRHPKLVLGLCGVLAGAVFSWRLTPWVLPGLLSPLLYGFMYSKKTPSFRTSLLLGLSFFVPFHAAVLSWFLDADISGLAGISSDVGFLASVISLCLMVSVTTAAMLPLIIVLYTSRSLFQNKVALGLLSTATAWVVSEWLRSLGFGAFLYGSGASIGDFWNFGSLGLAFMNTPLAYAARFIGMYGLTFIIVIVAGTIANAARTRDFRPLLGVTISFCILSGLGFLVYGSSTATRNGSVLQLKSAPQGQMPEIQTDNFSPDKKDMIVLPEYSYIYEGTDPDFAANYINRRLADNGVIINVSDGDQPTRFGTIEFRGNNGQILHSQTKELLIPTGEYLPVIFVSFFNLTGQSRVVDNFNATRQLARGQAPEVYKNSILVIGPVACSGILGRNIYRGLTRDGAQVLTNSASLLTFNGSRSYFRQSLQMARFHAIANNRTFIQSTKGGSAFVLNEDGEFLVSPNGNDTKFIDFRFGLSDEKTAYTSFGDWPLLLSTVIVLGFFGAAFKKRSSLAAARP